MNNLSLGAGIAGIALCIAVVAFVRATRRSSVFPPETHLLSKSGFRPRGFMQGIEILNDGTTPMEFVVSVLSRHLAISRREAIVKMLEIHHKGGLLIPFVSSQDGQRVAEAITAEARAAGHARLVCRYVDTQRSVGIEASNQ